MIYCGLIIISTKNKTKTLIYAVSRSKIVEGLNRLDLKKIHYKKNYIIFMQYKSETRQKKSSKQAVFFCQ